MDIKTADERSIKLKEKLSNIEKEQFIIRNHVVNYVVSVIERVLDNTLKDEAQVIIERLYPTTPFNNEYEDHMPTYKNYLEDYNLFSQSFDCRKLTEAEVNLIVNLYSKAGYIIEHNKDKEEDCSLYDTFYIKIPHKE